MTCIMTTGDRSLTQENSASKQYGKQIEQQRASIPLRWLKTTSLTNMNKKMSNLKELKCNYC